MALPATPVPPQSHVADWHFGLTLGAPDTTLNRTLAHVGGRRPAMPCIAIAIANIRPLRSRVPFYMNPEARDLTVQAWPDLQMTMAHNIPLVLRSPAIQHGTLTR